MLQQNINKHILEWVPQVSEINKDIMI